MVYLWILTVFLQVTVSENRLVTVKYSEPITSMHDEIHGGAHNRKDVSIEDTDNEAEDETDLEEEVASNNTPCTVVIVSNIQSPNTHALMRRYRYDQNGILIPSSVKYYMKRLEANSAHYVPLSDKAFTPQGGFIRHYKEVPAIPRIW